MVQRDKSVSEAIRSARLNCLFEFDARIICLKQPDVEGAPDKLNWRSYEPSGELMVLKDELSCSVVMR